MAVFEYPVTDVEASPGLTPSQTVGPFFHDSLPYAEGPSVCDASREGAFELSGVVYDGAGDPIPDSMVEIWQADEDGSFVTEPGIYAEPEPNGFRGFGRSATDADGRYRLTTIRPAGVPTAEGVAQAPHIAMSVFARGMLRRVVTRVYFPGEPANDSDPLLTSVEEARRSTLVASEVEGGYRFDVHIQGDDETVFLDVFAR